MSGPGHRIRIEEVSRCPNDHLKKDAVLVFLGGTSYKLFVVGAGKEVHGANGVLSLGHAKIAWPYIEWIDRGRLRVYAHAEVLFAPDRLELKEGEGFVDVLARGTF